MPDLPAVGSFVQRASDGMLGRVDKLWKYPALVRTDARQIIDVTWLGQWAKGDLMTESDKYKLLSGKAAASAAARFAALTCERCAGTGRTGLHRCSAEGCRDGRLLGVEPTFDAAHAGYEAEIASMISGEARRRTSNTQSEPRVMELRYWAICSVCQKRLKAGSSALGKRNASGQWDFSCLDCLSP